MAYIDKAALEAAGFTDEIEKRRNSVIVNLAGNPGTGKTTWALTAPKPLLYQSTDFGEDGVIQQATGQILRPKTGDYKLQIPHEYRAFVDRQESDSERKTREGRLANFVHKEFYEPFRKDLHAGIKAGARTVVWDTALEVWEFTRLSVYGREATNRSDLQAEANSKFKEMIRLCALHNVNLIMVNRLKPAWESYYDANGNIKWRKAEGKFEMQGFDKAPELVAISLWTDEQYQLEVKKCRAPGGSNWVGEKMDQSTFEECMAMLVPDVESWE